MQFCNELDICVRLIINYLESIQGKSETLKWDDLTSVVKAIVRFESECTPLHIVCVEIEKGSKCMISLFRNEESLTQSLFKYDTDFKIMKDTRFPLDYKDFIINTEDLQTVYETIHRKLNILTGSYQELKESASGETEHISGEYLDGHPKYDINSGIELGIDSDVSNYSRRPADMPGFEDEYEVNEQTTVNSNLPGLNIGRSNRHGYGDSDLYPMGQRHPNLSDPLINPTAGNSGLGSQGGMIFDPNQKIPLNNRNRGPGYIPGSKYDDPFGRTSGFGNSGGFGGPEGNSGGFGNGFI